MIVKITAQHSDGSTADFLSVDDFLAHNDAAHLHPDAHLTGAGAPVKAKAKDKVKARKEGIVAKVKRAVKKAVGK